MKHSTIYNIIVLERRDTINRYGEEIIISEELKQTIRNIKPLPGSKVREGLSILNYIFIGNILYFGYQNHCYSLEQMKFLFTRLKGEHGCYQYKEFDDYIALINQILDKMGITEEIYQKYKEDCYQDIRGEMLKRYTSFKERCGEEASIKYSLETRNSYAYLNYFFDNFVPFEIVETISEQGFYNIILVYEKEEDYKRLEKYVERQYTSEFEEASNKPILVFQKVFEPLFPHIQFVYDDIRMNKATIYVDLKREETDIMDNLDYEDYMLLYTSRIDDMINIAYQFSNYYCEIEAEFPKENEE